MEKISLKPIVRELIYKKESADSFFDAISYKEAGVKNDRLGSMFVIGNVKNGGDEEISYVINLASSIAKREYYSEASLKESSAKTSFERALKKTNEVLEDFFSNKDLRLDLALAAIAGENIYISKIGKLKVVLARDNETIDILNNVQLFDKDTNEGNKQFSNVISGKLKANDKIFAYLPFRTVTSREKQLKAVFLDQDQEKFSEKLAQLAKTVPNFYCCGVHISLTKVKEIPVDTSPIKETSVRLARAGGQLPDEDTANQAQENTKEKSDRTVNTEETDDETETASGEPGEDSDFQPGPAADTTQSLPRVIPSEVSLAKKHNAITSAASIVSKFKDLNKYNTATRISALTIVAGVVVAGVFGFIFFGLDGSPFGAQAQLVKKIEEDIKLAYSQITQNNIRSAREILADSLKRVSEIDHKKTGDLKAQIIETLDSVNKTSPDKPSLIFDAAMINPPISAVMLAENGDSIILASDGGEIFIIEDSNAKQAGVLKNRPRYAFNSGANVVLFDGVSSLTALNLESGKTENYSLGNSSPIQSAYAYENNIYVLSGNTVNKYSDAMVGGQKSSVWAELEDDIRSIAVDGNIYGLTSDGRLITLFKGEKGAQFDLLLSPDENSEIWTEKDFGFIYLLSASEARVMAFDKTSGQLKTTYDLSPADNVIDIFIADGGVIWALSDDNKVWKLTP